MQDLLATIQQWHIHPVVDHFTVAIFILAVVTDLIASLFSTRLWLRYAALALMIVAAGAAWGSSLTGGWEADKVRKAVEAAGGPAFAILKRHAELGDDIIPWVITALAVWRIGVQTLGFIASSRPLYLLVALAALVLVSYQGYLGGELVYDYGVGTAIFTSGAQAAPTPAPAETPSGPATPIPTVYVPAASATPSAGGAAAKPSATPVEGGAAGGAGGATVTPSGAGAAAPPTPAGGAEPSPSAAAPSSSPAPSVSSTPAPSASKTDELKASSAPPSAPGTTIRPPDPHPAATSL